MASDSEFPDYTLDLLVQVGPPFDTHARLRRMFGGHGIFCDGVMFALIADDALYLKVDDETRPEFTAVGSEPFLYEKAGKQIALSYMSVPNNTAGDIDALGTWAHMALAAANRAQARKPVKKGKPPA
ncbi:MAG: TfoX/Sxy family protein [Alphaproteobacteria bacterium]|jgi:DNA transformation protein and related proteins|nr:TfoX/Sxy family protein [Alphaproteobacteria bacterium]